MKIFTVSHFTPTLLGWKFENFQSIGLVERTAISAFGRTKGITFYKTPSALYEGSDGSVAYIELSSPTKPTLADFPNLPPCVMPLVEVKPKTLQPEPELPVKTYYVTDVSPSQGILYYAVEATSLDDAAAQTPALRRTPITISGATRYETAEGFILIYENSPNYR